MDEPLFNWVNTTQIKIVNRFRLSFKVICLLYNYVLLIKILTWVEFTIEVIINLWISVKWVSEQFFANPHNPYPWNPVMLPPNPNTQTPRKGIPAAIPAHEIILINNEKKFLCSERYEFDGSLKKFG